MFTETASVREEERKLDMDIENDFDGDSRGVGVSVGSEVREGVAIRVRDRDHDWDSDLEEVESLEAVGDVEWSSDSDTELAVNDMLLVHIRRYPKTMWYSGRVGTVVEVILAAPPGETCVTV